MKSTGLWIADPDDAYGKAFMEYVNLKESHLFHVRICTDREALIKALAGEEMEILLIAAEWYESCQALIHQKCTVILSEGSLVKEAEGCHAVYKYQSVENILRELMYYYSEQNTEGMYIEESRKDNRVIGIFSPVSESNQTVFALTLGQILAESQNVLYLNMEECSGMGEYMGESHWNISDLIYFLRQQNNAQFLYRLNSMVQKLDHLDYIPSCESYTDFHQIETEEWLELIRLIRARSSYDSVILDLGMAMGHETELLRQCDGIYVPVRQDMISRAKLAQWENAVQILGGLDIVEKFQKLEIPENSKIPESRDDLLMLPQQSFGMYIRGLLKG